MISSGERKPASRMGRRKGEAQWARSRYDFARTRRGEVRTYMRSAEAIHRTLGELLERKSLLLSPIPGVATDGDRALRSLMLVEVERILIALEAGRLPNNLLHGLKRDLDDRRLA